MAQQLDLFNDSRDVGLRNDLASALLAGDTAAARQACTSLRAEFGDDHVLAPAHTLVAQLDWLQSTATPGRLDLDTLLQARQRLQGPLAAAATTVMGPQRAPAWLAEQWCWLAEQASGITWHPARADAHAAALFVCAQAWPKAAQAVAGIESWRLIPQPLLWMTLARWHQDGADAAWPLLAEALWLAPARAAALLPVLGDTRLNKLVARFEEHFDPAAGAGSDWAWLPAYALVDQPLLAGPLAPATSATPSPAVEAFAVVMALLRLERQGLQREIVTHRARLKALSDTLFKAYMATR
jgi:hypothetical protein